MRFEWDSQKAQFNVKKHGVSFDEAATIFYDPLYLEDYDEAHSDQEDRFKIIGVSSSGRLLVVTCTQRVDRIRIISSRLATKNERRIYESQT
ncbi:MAG: BrnT family toxin [Nostoc sp. NMS7]|nr:BrnT family toxin [Nostoc sp. NMS7]MBN3951982.1 BrnT family toxin [Nostoc sp. NMS7]